jgi:hypothetical protein
MAAICSIAPIGPIKEVEIGFCKAVAEAILENI